MQIVSNLTDHLNILVTANDIEFAVLSTKVFIMKTFDENKDLNDSKLNSNIQHVQGNSTGMIKLKGKTNV